MTPLTVTLALRRGLTEPGCEGWWWARGKPLRDGQISVGGDGWPGPGWSFYYVGEDDLAGRRVEIAPGDRGEPPEYAPFDRFVEFCGPLPSEPPESGDVVAAERGRATKIVQEFESVWRGVAEAASDERARLQAHAKAEALGQVAGRLGGALDLELECRSGEMRRFVDDYAMNALEVEAWRQDALCSVHAEYERCANLAATWGHSIPPPGAPPTRDEIPADLRPALLALVEGGGRSAGRLSGLSPVENRLAGLGLVALELRAFAWWVVPTAAGRAAVVEP